MRVWAILVAAGSGERLGLGVPKAFVPLHGDAPLFLSSLPALVAETDGIVLVVPAGHVAEATRWVGGSARRGDGTSVEIRIVEGGSSRQASVAAGLGSVPEDAARILVHDAARPFLEPSLIAALTAALGARDGIVPVVAMSDTVKRVSGGLVVGTVPRDPLATAETPQLFRAEVLRAAHQIGASRDASDDAALVEDAGGTVAVHWLTSRGLKVTTAADLLAARERFARVTTTGIGFDAHPLIEGRPLVLGTVTIPFERGPEGHSDGDALAHAICDAMFGAAGMGDLGDHFPSGDERWRGASGVRLLTEARRIVEDGVGRMPRWVDATVIIQAPAIAPHREAMRLGIAHALGLEPAMVSVKATTTDRLGIIGEGAGVAAQAVVGLGSVADRVV